MTQSDCHQRSDFSKSGIIRLALSSESGSSRAVAHYRDISLFTSWTGHFLDSPVPALCGPFNRRGPVPRASLVRVIEA